MPLRQLGMAAVNARLRALWNWKHHSDALPYRLLHSRADIAQQTLVGAKFGGMRERFYFDVLSPRQTQTHAVTVKLSGQLCNESSGGFIEMMVCLDGRQQMQYSN